MSEVKEEKDPNGVAPNQPGAKLDHGKLRVGLVIKGFQNALKAVTEVGTFGANKYTDDGWKSVPDGLKRYEDALYRHLLADGMDEQSGLPHLAHAAWNILAMLELQATAPKGLVEDGWIDRMKRNSDRIRDIVAGTHFTESELAVLSNEEDKPFITEWGAIANWQFSREMWKYAYCNPKNAKLFEMVKEKWASHKSKSGVSVVLLNKDRFNASDLVVDGIHIPSLPKELINAALLRCYPLGNVDMSTTATILLKAGISFTAAEENK